MQTKHFGEIISNICSAISAGKITYLKLFQVFCLQSSIVELLS